MRAVARNTTTWIIPHIGNHGGLCRIDRMCRNRAVDTVINAVHGHQCLLAHPDKLSPQFFRERIAFYAVVVGNDKNARPHFRNIRCHETMNDGDG